MTLPLASAIRPLALPHISGTGEDAVITLVIAAANAALAAWCLYPPASATGAPTLEATSYVEFLDGPDRVEPRRLKVGFRPITAAAVAQDRAGDGAYSETVSTSDYTVDGVNGYLVLKPAVTSTWMSGFQAIRATVTAGFDTGAHPAITQAIALLVQHWWGTLRRVGPDVQSQTVEGEAVTWDASDLPLPVRQLMWPYRLIERER